MVHISCEFRTPIVRDSDDGYLRSLDLTVTACDDGCEPVIVGKYAADLLMLSDAEIADESISDICDQDSQELPDAYVTLFGEGSEFRDDRRINNSTEHLLFIRDNVLHPKMQEWESAILEAICTLFGYETVAAMWRHVTELPDRSLEDSGSARIAESTLLVRHMALNSPFSTAYPLQTAVRKHSARRADYLALCW